MHNDEKISTQDLQDAQFTQFTDLMAYNVIKKVIQNKYLSVNFRKILKNVYLVEYLRTIASESSCDVINICQNKAKNLYIQNQILTKKLHPFLQA